ncbi:MAG: hypothetical protein CMJ85_08570 [Planctomycetes bacterium]|nr:hypothetical protein [Planctomycetota bacterium]MDP6424760.1 PfkB family carbohydrate kinase [Planctomycetota bacterium]
MGWLESAFELVERAQVAVCGDFALDAYWDLDQSCTELSFETGKAVRRVVAQRYGLGGAGNVAANARSLGARGVRAIGLVGDDPFGAELRAQLERFGVDVSGMVDGGDLWQSVVYAKPHVSNREQERLDFGAANRLTPALTEALVDQLDRAAHDCDAVVLNQQIDDGVATGAMIERINEVIARHPDRVFVVDSRHRATAFRGAVLKCNAHEAAALCGAAGSDVGACARRLRECTGQTVFVTCGRDGLLVADESGVHAVAGVDVSAPVDPVGAGDTVVAALAGVLGCGGDAITAARLANLAAAVTVQKLGTTGTATPGEIRRLHS